MEQVLNDSRHTKANSTW